MAEFEGSSVQQLNNWVDSYSIISTDAAGNIIERIPAPSYIIDSLNNIPQTVTNKNLGQGTNIQSPQSSVAN